MIIPNLIVAEYSQQQKCFHIQSLTDSLKDSLMCALQNEPSDYSIIGVFNDDIEASNFIEEVRSKMKIDPYAENQPQ